MKTHATTGGWKPARHPTVNGYFCLARKNFSGHCELLANRLSGSPHVEAFATREQAERVAEHLARTRREVD
ncbi:hypothetical protein QTI17_33440 [Variovorax sp. J31P179]|jgi:hypothetical protein|uniref:hypothetical protein n=1 Tax=Variovorax sp. J31P179 TaxID=3053508 RepID=UPI00257784A3|nr:hypothetical protein [Variovorax sp. J31P179]MDM0085506.1 hypothetical protein [Variovorax sp. J31P179]